MKLLLVFLALVFFTPESASAAWSIIPGRDDPTGLANPFMTGYFEWNDILVYGLYLIRLLLEVAGMVAIIMVMMGGFRYIMPTEDAKEKGRDTLKHATIGFALIVLSWAIVDVVVTFVTSG